MGEIHRIWRNMSPIKKLSKRDDQLSAYGMSTSSTLTLWTTSHCRWLENVFFRNIRQWASSGHQVTVEANRHRLPNLLSNCGHSVKKWHIRRDWLTMTIRLLHLLPLWHWHWPNRFTTGRARGRGRNWPVLENSCKNNGACYVYLITW